jgi:prepilin-type processing-associated H-X9-DG protein
MGSAMTMQETMATPPRVILNSTTMPSQSIVCGEATDWDTASGDSWDYAYVYTPNIPNPVPPVGRRHSSGINMLWADGHAEWKDQSVLRTGANGDNCWYYKRVK